MNVFSARRQEVKTLHPVSFHFVMRNSAVFHPVHVAYALVKQNYYKFERQINVFTVRKLKVMLHPVSCQFVAQNGVVSHKMGLFRTL